MIEPNTKELFTLGRAYESFLMGKINQGIGLVLATQDPDTGEWGNMAFYDLVDEDFYNIDYPPGWDSADPKPYALDILTKMYVAAIVSWCTRHDLTSILPERTA